MLKRLLRYIGQCPRRRAREKLVDATRTHAVIAGELHTARAMAAFHEGEAQLIDHTTRWYEFAEAKQAWAEKLDDATLLLRREERARQAIAKAATRQTAANRTTTTEG